MASTRCSARTNAATDTANDEPGQRAFYESLGYTEIRDHGTGALRSFVRFDDAT